MVEYITTLINKSKQDGILVTLEARARLTSFNCTRKDFSCVPCSLSACFSTYFSPLLPAHDTTMKCYLFHFSMAAARRLVPSVLCRNKFVLTYAIQSYRAISHVSIEFIYNVSENIPVVIISMLLTDVMSDTASGYIRCMLTCLFAKGDLANCIQSPQKLNIYVWSI